MIWIAIFATLGAIGWTLFVMFANSMRSSPGAFVGRGTIIAAWCLAGALWLAWGADRAHAADLALPPEITIGRSQLSFPPFGAFTLQYMQRRWARLCKGGGRYQAMAEAHERGRPNPCR